jgi:hypothetical protein
MSQRQSQGETQLNQASRQCAIINTPLHNNALLIPPSRIVRLSSSQPIVIPLVITPPRRLAWALLYQTERQQ